MEQVLVAGASGLVGGHLVKSLLDDGYAVRAVGKRPVDEWRQKFDGAENFQLDLREKENCYKAVKGVDFVYNLAADIGGVNFIEKNKALCMLSVLINTHLLMAARDLGVKRYFYASTHAVAASDAKEGITPAVLEDGHIWEKLFSERLCRHFREDFGLTTRIGRLQNIYGTHDAYEGGRERVPAALCRKAIEAKKSGNHTIEIWGDGTQTRSFLYAGDAAEGIKKTLASDVEEPVRIGNNEFVTVNHLADIVEEIAGVPLKRVYNTSAPSGIARKIDGALTIDHRIGWQPKVGLREGMKRLYRWIEEDMRGKGKI